MREAIRAHQQAHQRAHQGASEGGPYVFRSGVRSMLFISVSTTRANLVRAQSSSARKHLPVGKGGAVVSTCPRRSENQGRRGEHLPETVRKSGAPW